MQRSEPGLILQQQPACLLTDLRGYTAAHMPRGHFIGPRLSLCVSCSPMPPVLCDHVRNSAAQYSPRQCQAWFSHQQRGSGLRAQRLLSFKSSAGTTV